MSDNKMRMLCETFENEKTGELVEGITLMIDGQLKTIFDIIIEKEENYNNYSDLLRDIIFSGINGYYEKYKQAK